MHALLTKEVRPVIFPAAAVIAGVLSALVFSVMQAPLEVHFLVVVLGSAYLAAVPFGLEFQQRTLGLLLSQPVPRSVMWWRKTMVILATGAVLAVMYDVACRVGHAYEREEGLVLISMTATVCSACFWTLVARSVIGGAAFIMTGQVLLALAANWVQAGIHWWLGPDSPAAQFIDGVGMYAAVSAYCVGFLWAGWREFGRLQVADVVHTGTRTRWGRTFAGVKVAWLQPERNTPVFNLVRNELQLHKPIYVLAVLFTMCWAATYGVYWVAPHRVSADFFVAIALALTVITALLAGSLSIAEEKAIGTADWHRTLPISWKRQWGIKVGVALSVTLVAGFALPFLLVVLAPNGVPGHKAFQLLSGMLCAGLSLLAVAVWASALTANTLRAAALATVMAIVLLLLFMLSNYVARDTSAGRQLEEGTSALLLLVVGWLQLTSGDLHRLAYLSGFTLLSLMGVVILVALIQSCSFYRPSLRSSPGPCFSLLLLIGGAAIWTTGLAGWQGAVATVALAALVYALARKHRWMNPRHAHSPFFAGVVLAAIGFLLPLVFNTLAGSIWSTINRDYPQAGLRNAVQAVAERIPQSVAERTISLQELEQTDELPYYAKAWLRGATVEFHRRGPGESVTVTLPSGTQVAVWERQR